MKGLTDISVRRGGVVAVRGRVVGVGRRQRGQAAAERLRRSRLRDVPLLTVNPVHIVYLTLSTTLHHTYYNISDI